jgi:hypothetical protein
MKLRVSITDENATRQYESTDVQDLRDAADVLREIATEHDPDARHRPSSAVRIKRFDVSWED